MIPKYPYLTQVLHDIQKKRKLFNDFKFEEYVKIPVDLIKLLYYRCYGDYNVAFDDKLWEKDAKRKFLDIAREDVDTLELLMRYAYFDGRMRMLTNAGYAQPLNVWISRKGWSDKKYRYYPFVFKNGKYKMKDKGAAWQTG